LLYKDGEFKDPEFARWASDHNCKWADSNFFISNKTGTLSSCCFIGSQLVLITNNDGNIELKRFDELSEDESYNIYHNGNFSKGKLIKTNNTGLYKITLANSQELITTGDHIFKTPNGDKFVIELKEISDSIMSTLSVLENDYNEYTYKDGYLIGSMLYNGNIVNDNNPYLMVLFNDELNLDKFKELFVDEYTIDDNDSTKIKSGSFMFTSIILKDPKYVELYNKFIRVSDDDTDLRVFSSDILNTSVDFRRGLLDALSSTVSVVSTDNFKSRIITSFNNVSNFKYVNEQIYAIIASLGLYPVYYVNKDIGGGINIVWYNKDELSEECGDYTVLDENDPNIVYTKIAHIEPYLDTDEDYVYCFVMDDVNDPYFTLPNGVVSHNCRLLSDSTKLTGFVNSLGAAGLEIGSVKVSTVNLHAIALESNKDEDKFLQILRDRILLNCKVLSVQRFIIKRNIDKGLLPNYSSGLTNIDRQFSTCGM